MDGIGVGAAAEDAAAASCSSVALIATAPSTEGLRSLPMPLLPTPLAVPVSLMAGLGRVPQMRRRACGYHAGVAEASRLPDPILI